MSKNDGWIKLHRSMLDWEWYEDANVFRVFTHLILTANHEDSQWKGIPIKRGQRITSLAHLSKETGLTIKAVRTALKKLESTSDIDKQGAHLYTAITICNYDTYQSQSKGRGKQGAGKVASKGHDKGQAKGNKQEGKEYKEDKKLGARARATSMNEVVEFCKSIALPDSDGEYLWEKWNGNGWQNGKNTIKDWKATIRSWKSASYLPSQKNPTPTQTPKIQTKPKDWGPKRSPDDNDWEKAIS